MRTIRLIVIITSLLPLLLHTIPRGKSNTLSNSSSYSINTLHPTPQNTIILNTPGPIKLDNNFSLDASISTTMIHITQNNINLDLKNFTLSQLNANSSNKNVTGIYIADGLSNITISNGNINNITGTALVIGENCFNITLNNLTIAQAKGGGIEIQNGSDTIFIENCFVGKSLSKNKNNFGISLSSNKNITINNCTCTGSKAPTNYNAFGLIASNCVDCSINNSIFNGNTGDSGIGIYFNNCNGCSLENNEFKGNLGSVTKGCGIELTNSSGNYIRECIAIQNWGTTNTYGIYIHNGSHHNQIKYSSCSYQQALSTGNAYGVFINEGNFNVLHNVSVLSNTAGTSSSSEGIGIKLLQTIGTTIQNCQCNYNNGNNGKGYGLYIIDTLQSIISDNKFYYNSGSNGSWGIKEETDEENNVTNFFTSNIAFGNTTNYSITHLTLNSIQTISYKAPRTANTNTLGNIDITI